MNADMNADINADAIIAIISDAIIIVNAFIEFLLLLLHQILHLFSIQDSTRL